MAIFSINELGADPFLQLFFLAIKGKFCVFYNARKSKWIEPLYRDYPLSVHLM